MAPLVVAGAPDVGSRVAHRVRRPPLGWTPLWRDPASDVVGLRCGAVCVPLRMDLVVGRLIPVGVVLGTLRHVCKKIPGGIYVCILKRRSARFFYF